MLAITLKHPWPYAILELGKRIENRTWRPPCAAIGQTIALHGGVYPKGRASDIVWGTLQILEASGLAPPDLALADVVRPGIVGSFVLERAFEWGQGDELDEDPWMGDQFGWVLCDVIKFREPIPCKGAQGLWKVPEDLLPLVRRRWKEARENA